MQSQRAAVNSRPIRQCTTKIDPLFIEILPVVMHDDKTDQNHLGAGGGGQYSWEFFRGVCWPVLQILTLFQTKNLTFSTPIFRPDILSPYPFSDLALRQKICHNYSIILECKQKHQNFKCILNSRISISFLFIWN